MKTLTVGKEVNWYPNQKTFIGDASEIFPKTPIEKEVIILNPATGNTATFSVVSALRDFEGDVIYWLFKNEQYKTTLKVFND